MFRNLSVAARAAARQFVIGDATAIRWMNRWRETGSVEDRSVLYLDHPQFERFEVRQAVGHGRPRHDAYVQFTGVRKAQALLFRTWRDRHARLEQTFQFVVRPKNREDVMDRTTRCPKCGKRMVPVVTISGRTELQCISCDDPAMKWAESPLTAPEKPIEPERV